MDIQKVLTLRYPENMQEYNVEIKTSLGLAGLNFRSMVDECQEKYEEFEPHSDG